MLNYLMSISEKNHQYFAMYSILYTYFWHTLYNVNKYNYHKYSIMHKIYFTVKGNVSYKIIEPPAQQPNQPVPAHI